MLKYTICFIKKDNEILLLNREKNPNMGLWNGVGGKINYGESPYDGVIRETFEETGIELKKVEYVGNVTWESNRGNSGMYVFIADIPEGINLVTPKKMEEGILDWRRIDWILDQSNKGIVSNLQMYLPKVLDEEYGLEHKFIYENGVMLHYSTSCIIEDDNSASLMKA